MRILILFFLIFNCSISMAQSICEFVESQSTMTPFQKRQCELAIQYPHQLVEYITTERNSPAINEGPLGEPVEVSSCIKAVKNARHYAELDCRDQARQKGLGPSNCIEAGTYHGDEEIRAGRGATCAAHSIFILVGDN